jgi:hypothetical protein
MNCPTTAFVTWAHDDQAWEKTIATLVFALREIGVEVDVDLFHVNDPDVNWATFGVRAITENEFTLIAVSPAFKERWEGTNNPRHGAGAAREANALKAIFDENQHAFFKKAKVVVLPGATVADIPLELRAAGQRFEVSSFDLCGLEDLVRTLTRQNAYVPPRVGQVPILPPRFMPDGSSLKELRSHLTQLDHRLRDPAIDDQARRENLDTERITVEAALATVSGRARATGSVRALRASSRWILVAALLMASVIAGAVLLGLPSGGASATSTLRTGPLSLTFASPWHQVASADAGIFPGLKLEHPISLAANAITLEAGSLHDYAAIPGDPPAGLTAQIGRPSEAETVSLGRVPAARDLWMASSDLPSRALFLISTDTDDLALACQFASPTTLSDCAKIAASVQVTGIHVLKPGRQSQIATGITSALLPELAARHASAGLASSRSATRSATAWRLAAVDATAAASLAHMAAPARLKATIGALSLALQREADALSKLAQASNRRVSGLYNNARRDFQRAGDRVSRALAVVRAAGYVASLASLPMPAQSLVADFHGKGTSAPAPGTANAVAPSAVVRPLGTSLPTIHASPKKREYGPTVVTKPIG